MPAKLQRTFTENQTKAAEIPRYDRQLNFRLSDFEKSTILAHKNPPHFDLVSNFYGQVELSHPRVYSTCCSRATETNSFGICQKVEELMLCDVFDLPRQETLINICRSAMFRKISGEDRNTKLLSDVICVTRACMGQVDCSISVIKMPKFLALSHHPLSSLQFIPSQQVFTV